MQQIQRPLICMLFALIASIGFTHAQVGWSCFANGSRVYICQAGGTAQVIYNGGGDHACFSADGKLVFFSKRDEVWAIQTNGTGAVNLGTHTTGQGATIAAYRPEPQSVMVAVGDDLYKIDAATKERALIFSGDQSFYGELSISEDGKRLAARLGDYLYKTEIIGTRGTWTLYARYCSASLSPNGKQLTENQNGHTRLIIFDWDTDETKTMQNTAGGTWDNQRFAVNSNDWISLVFDYESGANNGDKVGAHQVSTNTTTVVGMVPLGSTAYPDFWVGALPTPDSGSVRVTPFEYKSSGLSQISDTKNAYRLTLKTSQHVRVQLMNLAGQPLFTDHWNGTDVYTLEKAVVPAGRHILNVSGPGIRINHPIVNLSK